LIGNVIDVISFLLYSVFRSYPTNYKVHQKSTGFP